MNYSDARPQIKSGHVIGFSGGSLIGGGLRMYQGSHWSHVSMAYVTTSEGTNKRRVWLLESMEGAGVTMRPLSHAGDFWWAPIDCWTSELEDWIVPQIDKVPYNNMGIVRRFFGMNPTSKKNVRFCSQLTAKMLRIGGQDIPGPTPDNPYACPGNHGPGKVIDWCAGVTTLQKVCSASEIQDGQTHDRINRTEFEGVRA